MQKTSENVLNPQLVNAMREMIKNPSDHTRSVMAGALVEARLLSPVQAEKILTTQSGPEQRIRFEELTNTQGDRYYLAFTDKEEYSKWDLKGNHSRALIMGLEDFGRILIQDVNNFKGFVINPFGENVCISKELLLSLLKQKAAKAQANQES